MARIIYKEGLEGQNTLESIEGIEIDLLNGQKALIYPKYAEKVMLYGKNIASWKAKEVSEVEALKNKDNQWATGALLKCGSTKMWFLKCRIWQEKQKNEWPTAVSASISLTRNA